METSENPKALSRKSDFARDFIFWATETEPDAEKFRVLFRFRVPQVWLQLVMLILRRKHVRRTPIRIDHLSNR